LSTSSLPTTWDDLSLLPHHVEQLKASGISPAVASQRGYRSITEKSELAQLGYAQKVQRLIPGLLMPQHVVTGQPFEQVYRPDAPRRDDSGKERKYEYRYQQRMVLDIAPSMLTAALDPTQPLWVTEGIKKGDALATVGVPCIALGGVWNWRTRKQPQTGKPGPLPDWQGVPLANRTVVIAFDSDVMEKAEVHDALEGLTGFLEGENARVRYCYLPPGENGAKVGLDDFLTTGHTVDDLWAAVSDELRMLPSDTRTVAQDRPKIRLDWPPLMQKQSALRALAGKNDPPTLFSSGGALVRVAGNEHGTSIQTVAKPMMRHRLEEVACWQKLTMTGQLKEVAPPTPIIEDILDLPDHALRFPVLTQVVTAPCFAPDGTLIIEAGYSSAGKLFFDPRGLVVPSLPSPADALDLICGELLADFPFADAADLANALALYLLPFARPLIPGTTPMHMVEAPTPGTGKGLLADMLMYPVDAGRCARTTETDEDNEWRKRITSALLAGRQIILIDNINRPLDSGVLASALTADIWEDRLLGINRVVTLVNRAIWVVTANNPVLSAELARRTVYIRLDPSVERPWDRTEFRHSDLRGWVSDHRGALVAAGLAIVKAWLDAGKPMADIAFGDYRGWAQTMGGMLQVAGVPGFLNNATDRFDAAAGELDELRAFVLRWWDIHADRPVKVSDLLEVADFWCVGPQIADKKDPVTAFGMWLKKQLDRVVDGKRITMAKRDRNGAKYYRLAPLPASAQDPTEGFRIKSPAQAASAEPCGTLVNPPEFSDEGKATTALNSTAKVSGQGPAGVRMPTPTSTNGAEPSVQDADEIVEVEL